MKTRKLFILCLALFGGFAAISAQEKLSKDSTQLLFDDNGSMTQIKEKPEDIKASIISINPRVDDAIWRKTILRVVDMREMQNRPLYYPYEDIEPTSQKNLFAIILKHVLDSSLTAYKSQVNPQQTFVPKFNKENEFDVQEFLTATGLSFWENDYDKINYMTPGVVKYYVQEMWYFNKSTSEFKHEIIAIAPLYDEKYNERASDIRTSVFFWVPFKKLRPFLKEEYIKMYGRNTAPLVDFDNFFVTRQFSSYIIKDYDLTSYDIDRNIENPDRIAQEQARVEAEILDFEQDLWQY